MRPSPVPNERPLDLDELIASGEIEGDVVAARKRLDEADLNRAFYQALREDVELLIEIAEASGRAVAKEAERQAARALVSEEERRERRREVQRAYNERRRATANSGDL